jgi:hypothetical protein
VISRFAAPSARLGQSGGHALGVRLERGVDREVEWREDAEGDDAGSATSSARHRILPDPLRQCCCRGVQAVDANRRGDFPNQSFDFLGFTFRARKAWGRGRQPFACSLPAASPKALTSISRTVRRWALHHRSDKSLQDLAEMCNPCIRGWINYYSHFYKTQQLRPTLKRIDLRLRTQTI